MIFIKDKKMNDNNIFEMKKKMIKKDINSHEPKENQIFFNSILKRKVNTRNIMKSLNTEISFKSKDNKSLDAYNNNVKTLSSLLSKKKNYNNYYKEDNIIESKIDRIKTIETIIEKSPLNEKIINGGTEIKANNNIDIMGKSNKNIIKNKRINNRIYTNFKINHSPYLEKKIEEKKPKIIIKDQILISKNKDNENKNDLKSKNTNADKEEKFEKEKTKINIKQGAKIYQKKAIKNFKNNNLIKNEIKNPAIVSTNINGSENKEKDKYISLLNNYRKRVIKQFMLHFKPYCNSFIKNYFQIFILNIKNINSYSTTKKYIKKMNKGSLYNNEKQIKDLKIIKLNYTNNNLSNRNNYNYTENTNNYLSKKIENEKSNSKKKKNYFLINNNNINLNSNKSLNKIELYRNNNELLKKYSEIIKRKKRKNLEIEDHLSFKNKRQEREKYITIFNKKNYTVNNSLERKKKIEYSSYSSELMNSYNTISNGEESLNIEKNRIVNIKSTTRKNKDNNKRIKRNIKLDNIGDLVNSISEHTFSNNKSKNYLNEKNKSKNNSKEKKRIRVFNLKEKINTINNSHYNKNFICKTIKNIFTRDKKINIHINYVFFIPSKIMYKKNLEIVNKFLDISHNYNYSYIGKQIPFNRNKNIISKNKLTSIKEEEEKSKCSISLSMILQNSKTVDEYNSIDFLIERIKKYYIIKMKKIFLSKLKILRFIICLNKIFRIIIFKIINSINK